MSSRSHWPDSGAGRLPDAPGLPPLTEGDEERRSRVFRFGRSFDEAQDAARADSDLRINGVRVPPSLEAELRRHQQESMGRPERTGHRPVFMAVPLVGIAMVVAGVGWAAFDRFHHATNPRQADRFSQVADAVPTFAGPAGEQADASLIRARDQIAVAGTLPAGTYGLAQQEQAVRPQVDEEAVQPRTEIALAPAAVAPEVVEPRPQNLAPAALPQPTAPQSSAVGPASAPPPSAPAPRQIDPEELEILKKQAADFVAAGDLISARRIFMRAAEARDPEAALAVGATYDPITIEQFGVRGMQGDIDKAREWYRKAEELGSMMAAKRLELLAQRDR